jgi:general secretion pathway protein J
MSPTRKRYERGLTLIEVLVSLAIMSLIASLIYGAYDGVARSRAGAEEITDRYHQGRTALSRMTRELQSAYLSVQDPLELNLVTRKTAFIGVERRVDFTSFSHQRVAAGTHETDQNELSYFLSPNPRRGVDLVRRESKYIDLDPQHGGVVQVLAEDVASFSIEYLDGLNGQWMTSWDTTNLNGQILRLPQQVRIELVLNRQNGERVPFLSKVALPIQAPLMFAVPR